MNKEILIEYLYAFAARVLGEDNKFPNIDENLSNELTNINDDTSYNDLYNIVKKINENLSEPYKDKQLEEYLKNEAIKEKEEKNRQLEDENKEKMPVANSNVSSYENVSHEGIKDCIAQVKDAAESKGNYLKVHVSLVNDKIKIDVNQFGENINGTEVGYSLIYDRYIFNEQDIMYAINDSFVGNDKINSSDNQRFYDGKQVTTNFGHQLTIDPAVKEAIARTDDFVENNKKGNARVRSDEQNKETATSNIIIIAIILLVIIITTYIFLTL